MKFAIFIFAISFILPICESFLNSTSSSNCFATSPKIVIETNSASFNARIPSLSNVENVEDATVSRSYFNCVDDSSPVQWIIDIHPLRDLFQFTRSFYTRSPTTIASHNNQTIFTYSAYTVFLYKLSELRHPTLFICQNECGFRTLLEISPGSYSPIIQVTSFPSSPTFAEKLDKIINKTVSPVSLPRSSCPMALHLQTMYVQTNDGNSNHHLYYVWRPVKDGVSVIKQIVQSSQTTTDQGIYFRNVFRTVPHDPNCVEIISTDSPACLDCTEVIPTSLYADDTIFLNSIAFYARSISGDKLAFKGVFSVTKPRKFYLEPDLPLEELVDFQPPPILYVGHEVVINCSVSTIYFAYGTRIHSDDDGDDDGDSYIAPNSNHTETETWTPHGHRVVSKRILFQNGTKCLTCSAPLWNWSRRVEKRVQVFIEYPIIPRMEGISLNESALIVTINQENVTLTCSSEGKPRPSLEWIFPNANASFDVDVFSTENDEIAENFITSTISIPKIQTHHLGSYVCNATNMFGAVSKSFSLQLPIEGLSTSTKVWLSSSLGALAFLGITSVLLIHRKILLQRKEYRTKTAQAIQEFKEGMKLKHDAQKEKESWFGVDDSAILKKVGGGKERKMHTYESHHTPHVHHTSILELPYDTRFEVDLDKWEIEDKVLGQGAFGFVRKGAVQLSNKTVTIAIKVLKSSVEIDDFKSFLTELKIMAFIGKHPNIVSLVAACTQNIEQRDVMIGVEFCTNGSLQDYFKEKRAMFQTADGSLAAESSRNTYTNLSNSVALTELDLYTWSYQITNGMEFLARRQVLHGDLATRNVLLTSDKTAKISDFGLSRLLLDSKNYTKKSKVPLPWKWMAPESLKALKFSSSSDVWAFGVTIFEIFTLGEVPYAGLSFGPEFILQLEDGFRLAKPPLATDYLYNIMKHCWNTDPESRVTFLQLKTAFSELLDVFTNPSGAPVPSGSSRTTPTTFQHSPIPQPRRTEPQQNWYSNRPMQIPNLYLNV